MKKCNAKCLKGFDRCCRSCELLDLCEDACTNIPERCGVQQELELKGIKTKLKRIYITSLVGVLLILGMTLVIIGILNEISLQQVDTLNTIQINNQEEKTVVSEDLTPLTPLERDLVERVVMSESGNQSLEAQMAVAQTISDRMNDFGDTLQVAIRTYSQNDNGEPTDSVKLAVRNVFDKGARIYEGGTYQFHDDSVLPYWTDGKINRGSIGNLRFYGGYENEI